MSCSINRGAFVEGDEDPWPPEAPEERHAPRDGDVLIRRQAQVFRAGVTGNVPTQVECQQEGDEHEAETAAERQRKGGPPRISHVVLHDPARGYRHPNVIEPDVGRRRPVHRAKLQRVGRRLGHDVPASAAGRTRKQSRFNSSNERTDKRARRRTNGCGSVDRRKQGHVHRALCRPPVNLGGRSQILPHEHGSHQSSRPQSMFSTTHLVELVERRPSASPGETWNVW